MSYSRWNGEVKSNHAKEEKKKAGAPSLSSWTLCLQAALVFEGWHPSIPEQQEEEEEGDLERQGEKKKQMEKRQMEEKVSQAGSVLVHRTSKVKYRKEVLGANN